MPIVCSYLVDRVLQKLRPLQPAAVQKILAETKRLEGDYSKGEAECAERFPALYVLFCRAAAPLIVELRLRELQQNQPQSKRPDCLLDWLQTNVCGDLSVLGLYVSRAVCGEVRNLTCRSDQDTVLPRKFFPLHRAARVASDFVGNSFYEDAARDYQVEYEKVRTKARQELS